MSQTAAAADRRTLSVRAGTSRKLLARKAAEIATETEEAGEALEELFPVADADAATLPDGEQPAGEVVPAEINDAPASNIEPAGDAPALSSQAPASEPESASLEAPQPVPVPAAPPAPAWSSEDESALNALLARRKAAGYQRRGRDVSGQLIRAGEIKPNPNTVVAVIVGLVAERGSVGRSELIDLMASAAFPHGKARPADKGWCQGYVAGAIRSGFLALGDGRTPAVPAGEPSVSSACEGSQAEIGETLGCEASKVDVVA